jgi:fructosamine-3-kinase
MFLSGQLFHSIQHLLRKKEENNELLRVIKRVSGGSINDCYRIMLGKKDFFVKVNVTENYPNMFLAEAQGLKLLAESHTIKVPEVIAQGVAGREQFLVLEWIEQGSSTDNAQEELGIKLAALHQNTAPQFGLEYPNYMGSLTQSNNYHLSWTDFFIVERLEPQVKIGVEKGMIYTNLLLQFTNLFKRLDQLYPHEKPALVHGDLWSGNYLINTTGEPVLIDPAVAFVHREVDIAMTSLFGGFDPAFYQSYNESFPLEKGWEKRADLWNLYPLLVHVNLFGGSYLQQVQSCLNQFL